MVPVPSPTLLSTRRRCIYPRAVTAADSWCFATSARWIYDILLLAVAVPRTTKLNRIICCSTCGYLKHLPSGWVPNLRDRCPGSVGIDCVHWFDIQKCNLLCTIADVGGEAFRDQMSAIVESIALYGCGCPAITETRGWLPSFVLSSPSHVYPSSFCTSGFGAENVKARKYVNYQ